jgi:hypothetical protein
MGTESILRIVVFETKCKIGNVHSFDSYITIPSSQTYRTLFTDAKIWNTIFLFFFFSPCVSLLVNGEYENYIPYNDRLCGLVVRALGYRFGGPGSISGTTKKKK